MLSPSGHPEAPAADGRRRCRYRAYGWALLLLALMASCARPEPAGRWDGVRGALVRSVREVRVGDVRAARRIERLIAEAESVTAAERAASAWARHPGRVEAAWLHAEEIARNSVMEVRSARAGLRSRLDGLVREAARRVETERTRRGRAGMAESESALLAGAEYRLAAARSLSEKGQLEAATVLAREALAYADELDAAWSDLHRRFGDRRLTDRWRRQVVEAIAQSRRTRAAAIVVDKLHRRLTVYRAGAQVAGFDVELGSGGLGRKLRAGDRATPEGRYRIVQKKAGAATRFHRALLIDYPNADDRRRYRAAVRNGEIPRGAGLGGLIEIHGGGGSGRDWTDGCVALTDREMERVYDLVAVGTPVVIVGAR